MELISGHLELRFSVDQNKSCNRPILFVYLHRSRRCVGDKPMSCKPGVAGLIPDFSQSVKQDFKPRPRLLRCFKTRTTAGEPSGAPGQKTTKQ